MPTSQCGLSAGDPNLIHAVLVPGTDVKITVRKGSVGDLLIYVAARYHREVEPLRAADGVLDCWGYAFREIRGSATELSNHAAGAAVDLRARKHPMGTAVSASFTPAQIAACTRIMSDCAPVIRWGGTYSGRVDSMHWEGVSGSEADYAAVLARVQGGGGMSVWDRKEKPWGGGISNIEINSPADLAKAEEYDLFQYVQRVVVESHQTFKLLKRISDLYATDRQDLLNAIGSLQSELAALKSKLGQP